MTGQPRCCSERRSRGGSAGAEWLAARVRTAAHPHSGQRGAIAVEFTGLLPVLLAVLAVLWQCVLIGYTFTLAGNAADEGAHAATSAAAYGDPVGACRSAATEHLPAAWSDGAAVSCTRSGPLWKADVRLQAPVLFPGAAALPFTLSGTAGATVEGDTE